MASIKDTTMMSRVRGMTQRRDTTPRVTHPRFSKDDVIAIRKTAISKFFGCGDVLDETFFERLVDALAQADESAQRVWREVRGLEYNKRGDPWDSLPIAKFGSFDINDTFDYTDKEGKTHKIKFVFAFCKLAALREVQHQLAAKFPSDPVEYETEADAEVAKERDAHFFTRLTGRRLADSTLETSDVAKPAGMIAVMFRRKYFSRKECDEMPDSLKFKKHDGTLVPPITFQIAFGLNDRRLNRSMWASVEAAYKAGLSSPMRKMYEGWRAEKRAIRGARRKRPAAAAAAPKPHADPEHDKRAAAAAADFHARAEAEMSGLTELTRDD